MALAVLSVQKTVAGVSALWVFAGTAVVGLLGSILVWRIKSVP